jgi:hypothetical protein
MVPTRIRCLKYPLSRRPPAGRPMATKNQSCVEPIQLTLEEDAVPARTYRSWYTPNDDMYPKVAKIAIHLRRSHQCISACNMKNDNTYPPATVHHAVTPPSGLAPLSSIAVCDADIVSDLEFSFFGAFMSNV